MDDHLTAAISEADLMGLMDDHLTAAISEAESLPFPGQQQQQQHC
jgi:hypothetical protein